MPVHYIHGDQKPSGLYYCAFQDTDVTASDFLKNSKTLIENLAEYRLESRIWDLDCGRCYEHHRQKNAPNFLTTQIRIKANKAALNGHTFPPIPEGKNRRYIHGDMMTGGKFYCARCDLAYDFEHFWDFKAHIGDKGSSVNHLSRYEISLKNHAKWKESKTEFRPDDAPNIFAHCYIITRQGEENDRL